MEEIEIFSQFIRSYEEEDSIFVRMTTDMDIAVLKIIPLSMTMNEKMGRGTPSIVFDFIDGNGDLSNVNIPHSGAMFYLDIGRGILNTRRLKMRVSNVMSLTSTNGSEQLTYRLTFVHAGWDTFIGQNKCRSWGEKNPTEVVAGIANECGWETVVSHMCDDQINILQPNMTNVDFLKWLSKKTTMEDGFPLYSGTISDKFIFKSIQRIITENTILAKNHKLPILRHEGQISSTSYQSDRERNAGVPGYFTAYKITENPVETRISGSGGFKSYLYDSEKDEFKVEAWRVRDVPNPQMADWVYSSDSFAQSDIPLYLGRGSDAQSESIARVSQAIDMSVELEITTEGSMDIEIARMFEIIIPIPPTADDSGEIYNVIYSGFWIVKEVNHAIRFSDSSMTTYTKLFRSGHDSKKLSGFERTAGGKFVGG